MKTGVLNFVLVVVEGTIFVVKRGCLAKETSSSMAALLRLILASKYDGSTFSESDSSGESALLFRLDVELGVMAARLLGTALRCSLRGSSPFCLFLMLCRLRSLDSPSTPNG